MKDYCFLFFLFLCMTQLPGVYVDAPPTLQALINLILDLAWPEDNNLFTRRTTGLISAWKTIQKNINSGFFDNYCTSLCITK